MVMFVIYNSPSDYPGKWVVRRWNCLPVPTPTEEAIACESLDEARQTIPQGALLLARHPDDDPVIHETWI